MKKIMFTLMSLMMIFSFNSFAEETPTPSGGSQCAAEGGKTAAGMATAESPAAETKGSDAISEAEPESK